jgi:RNA polymerase sigma factor (TIGR02999 family)
MTCGVSQTHELSFLLQRCGSGDPGVDDQIYGRVYEQLRRIAGQRLNRERKGHTLQRTALVNEAFLKLANQRDIRWQGRSHFFAVASQIMRRILVDYARHRNRLKGEGAMTRVQLKECHRR